MGLVRPSDLGVRGALVATIMPPDQLIGAISVSRTTMDTARIAGALSGAGLLAGLGIGPAYVAIVCLYAVSTALTLCVVAPAKPHPVPEGADGARRRSPMRDLREGVAYVWTTPTMRAAIWIAFLANLTAYPFSNGLLPYIAREVYGTGQTGLGYLSASFAVGSLVGSIALSVIGGIRVARLMIGATVLWYAMLLVFAHTRSVPAAIACLLLVGAYAERAGRDRLPAAGRLLAKPVHDFHRGDPDAHRKRALPRPRDGRAHARDLRPAARAAGGRGADRRGRLYGNRDPLCRRRSRAAGGHRFALAHGSVARSRAGECKMKGRC